MENIVRKGEIACYKQFLLFSQCFLPYMALIFHFKCTLKCYLEFVSIWNSLKFCRLVMAEQVISWRSVTHNVFPGFLTPVLTQLFFPNPRTTFLTCFCRGEK